MQVLLGKEVYLNSSVIVNDRNYGCCSTFPAHGVSAVQAFFLEFLGTMFLIFIVCSVHDDRTLAHRDSFSVKAGLLIACVVVAIVSKIWYI